MKAGYPGKLFLYADYVKKALDCFSEEVGLWFAFTEPNIPIDNGDIKQIWYPFVHAPKKHIRHISIKLSPPQLPLRLPKSIQM